MKRRRTIVSGIEKKKDRKPNKKWKKVEIRLQDFPLFFAVLYVESIFGVRYNIIVKLYCLECKS